MSEEVINNRSKRKVVTRTVHHVLQIFNVRAENFPFNHFEKTFMLLVCLQYLFFVLFIQEDPTTRKWLQQLIHNVGGNRVPALQGGGGFDHLMVN